MTDRPQTSGMKGKAKQAKGRSEKDGPPTFKEAAEQLGEDVPFDDVLRRLVNTPPKPSKPPPSKRRRPDSKP